jgi:hypothetical protein
VWPCGAGTWGDIQGEQSTEYVDQGYAGGDSDGSPGRPWTTVQAGVDAAEAGAIVAVAEGRYEEDVVIFDKPVRLWGRCPARTEIVGRGAQPQAIRVGNARASGAEVRGLAVTGPLHGVMVEGAREVVLEALRVHDAGRFGVIARDGAAMAMRGALVDGNHEVGVIVADAEATIEATVVRATQMTREGEFGRGIQVSPDEVTGEGAKLAVTASLVEQNHEVGVFVLGSEAALEATVVRATQPNRAGQFGRGIGVQPNEITGEAGKLWLMASLVEQNHNVGVAILGSEATIEDTAVRATGLASVDDPFGDGIVGLDDIGSTRMVMTATESTGNARVGVLCVGIEGEIAGVRSSGNRFGLVLQHGKCRSNTHQQKSGTV